MRFVICALVWMGLCSTALADGFMVDLSAQQIKRLDGKAHVADLEVGQTAEVGWFPYCLQDGQVFLSADAEIETEGRPFLRLLVTRTAVNTATLTLKPTERTSTRDLRRFVSRLDGPTCSDRTGSFGEVLGQPLRIEAINGVKTLTALLESPMFKGLR